MQLTIRPIAKWPKTGYPRIIGVFMDTSASTYYRIQLPLKALMESGHRTAWGPIALMAHATDKHPEMYDMAVTSRTGNGDPKEIVEAIRSEQDLNHIVILDYDDDVLNIPDHNPAKHDSVEGIKTAVRTADGITVTNKELVKVFSPYTDNIAIIPNYVDQSIWPEPKFTSVGGCRIGLFGSHTHRLDWEQTSAPLHRVKEHYGNNIDIVCGGFLPEYLKDIARLLPWGPIEHYPKMLQKLDIGLAPLIDDHFNRCKSPIKCYEYGLAGAAVIASPVQYGIHVEGRGVVARNEEEWYEGLVQYIENPEKRKEDAQKLRTYLLEKIDYRQHTKYIANQYMKLYQTAREKRKRK